MSFVYYVKLLILELLLMRIYRRVDDAENIPVSLNVEVKMKGEECRRKKK